MALLGGHRFAVSMGDVFPHGFYAMGVEQAMDWDEKTGRRSASRDKRADNEWVWTVTGIDRDSEARDKQVRVKVTAPVQPVLPGEIAPGTGLHAVEFTGLTITPYVSEGRGRARLAFSVRATGVVAQGSSAVKTPTERAGRGSGEAKSA